MSSWLLEQFISGIIYILQNHVLMYDEFYNCHSPTQPQLELELDLIMGRNPPPPYHTGTFKALPDNLGSLFSVCNLILTQLESRL